MKTKKAVIIGNFNFGQSSFNGQTMKTRDYYYYFCERYGKENIETVDTAKWKNQPLNVFFQLLRSCVRSENVVLLLGVNSAKAILPITVMLKKILKYKILFPIVGGSIKYEYKQHKILKGCLSKVNAIYFETKMLRDYFFDLGFTNSFYVPVFTKRRPTQKIDISKSLQTPLKLCTYSRVCKEKGISLAIDAVKKVNERAGKIICTLDVIGSPYPEYIEEFSQKIKGCDSFIKNKPYLEGDFVIDALSNYALMLFPTFYEGEGFPIAIVECMFAGVPVIASDWHFNSEIVLHNQTGMIFSLKEVDALETILYELISQKDKLYEMKMNCLNNARNYLPENVLMQIFEEIE